MADVLNGPKPESLTGHSILVEVASNNKAFSKKLCDGKNGLLLAFGGVGKDGDTFSLAAETAVSVFDKKETSTSNLPMISEAQGMIRDAMFGAKDVIVKLSEGKKNLISDTAMGVGMLCKPTFGNNEVVLLAASIGGPPVYLFSVGKSAGKEKIKQISVNNKLTLGTLGGGGDIDFKTITVCDGDKVLAIGGLNRIPSRALLRLIKDEYAENQDSTNGTPDLNRIVKGIEENTKPGKVSVAFMEIHIK